MKEKFNKYICDFEGCRHRNEENVCCLFNQENCILFRTKRELEEVKANADYQFEGRDVTIKELEEQNTNLQEMLKAERSVTCKEEYLKRVTELEAHIDKMKYALNKIIKTVHNDNISGYGDRLVMIYDISCEVLQELEK